MGGHADHSSEQLQAMEEVICLCNIMRTVNITGSSTRTAVFTD